MNAMSTKARRECAGSRGPGVTAGCELPHDGAENKT